MHKLKYLTIAIILVMSLSLEGLAFGMSPRSPAATSPTLGAASGYSVLGASTVTNTGPTTTSGAVGVSPGTSITGFPPGTAAGGTHFNDPSAISAQASNLVAFGALAQSCVITYPGVKDLVGSTLAPGVYCADAFTLTGTLTLSGSGVWIFKSAATLITSGTANVVGGDPCNVWWRVVSSATLGTGTSLIGNILAHVYISLATGATLNGRALAQIGAVTLDSNTITGAICLAAGQTATPITAAAATATAAANQTATAAALSPAAKTATAAALSAGSPTATPRKVTGLPSTCGAPIRNEDFPWSLLVIVGGFSAIALVLGVREYRRTHLPKQ